MDMTLQKRITTVLPLLNESQKRRYLAAEAISLGHGGIKEISAISGMHRNTISAGIQELKNGIEIPETVNNDTRIRAPGGGRKSIAETQPGILNALECLVDPETYGNPMNPLRWTTKGLRKLAEELRNEGYEIHHDTVGDLLVQLGYSLQRNRKRREGNDTGRKGDPVARNTQFQHINETAKKYLDSGKPVISIDCRKKENTGNVKTGGAEYQPIAVPVETDAHDFKDKEKDQEKETVALYGIYDIAYHEGFVNAGISSDTAVFAANSIRGWWYSMGASRYPNATNLYITADGGGSHSSRIWKKEVQLLADELMIPVEVSHFPSGISKWRIIEHRLFSQMTKNWRGRPLETIEIVISLIGPIITEDGLVVNAALDLSEYDTGIKVTDEEMADINIAKNPILGEWNYIIYPHS